MCEPTTIALASFALSTGSALMAHKQAAGQAKVQTALHKMNQQNAIEAMQQSFTDINTRQGQEQQSAAEAAHNRNREAMIQASRASAAIGESGTTGFSMNNIMRDIFGQASRDVSTIHQNRDWTVAQLEREKQGVRTGTISRMGQTTKGIGPSKLATGLQIGAGALNAGAYYQANK